MPPQIELVDCVFNIFEDLGPFTQLLTPIRIDVEVERVQNSGHIASDSRIRVCAPRSAYAIELVVDCEVAVTEFVPQRVRHGYTGRPCADYDNMWARHAEKVESYELRMLWVE